MKLQRNIEHEQSAELKIGDKDAFVKIYNLYWRDVYTIAYQRVRNIAIAEELTQNLFIKLWEKRDQLDVRDLENYIFISIKNAVINHVKSEMQFNRYIEHYHAFLYKNLDSLSDEVKFNDLEEAINAGLSRLPEKTQIVFRLNRLENWPLAKISAYLNLSEKTVGYHLTKSLKFMRSYLKEFIFFILIFLH